MKTGPRGACLRALRLRRDPAVVIGICPMYHPRVGISEVLLLSTYRGVNMFVGVGNDLPAALPHAIPRLKIQMAPRWCCRVTPTPTPPRAGTLGVGILGEVMYEKLGVKVQGVFVMIKVRNEDWPPGCLSWENSCSQEIADKGARGSWWSSKWRFRSETKIGPRGAYRRGLRLGRDPVVLIGIVAQFTHGGSVSWEHYCCRDSDGKYIRSRGKWSSRSTTSR